MISSQCVLLLFGVACPLQDLDKHLKPSDDHGLVKVRLILGPCPSNHSPLLQQNALVEMTKVAEHINTMKKKYEESDVKIQEIQSLIRGAEVRVDVKQCATCCKAVLEVWGRVCGL